MSRVALYLPFPPCVGTDGKAPVASLAVSTTAACLDLLSLPAYGTNIMASPPGLVDEPNVLGHVVRLSASGADVWFMFGPTLASLTTANVPLQTVRTALASNLITPAVGVCVPIFNNTYQDFFLPVGSMSGSLGIKGSAAPCRFLGYVTAAGTSVLTVTMAARMG